MIYDSQQKTMTTERLLLRLFQTSDAPQVAKLCNNYNIFKHTLHLPYPYAVEDALSWIENHLGNFNENRLYEFAITDKMTGELYGAIALSNNQNFNHGEMAYWIGEEFWGYGYATEAAEAVLAFAFNEIALHRVYARHFHSNAVSGRVLQKIGMKKEGTLREHVVKEGQYKDLVYYGIIKSRV